VFILIVIYDYLISENVIFLFQKKIIKVVVKQKQ